MYGAGRCRRKEVNLARGDCDYSTVFMWCWPVRMTPLRWAYCLRQQQVRMRWRCHKECSMHESRLHSSRAVISLRFILDAFSGRPQAVRFGLSGLRACLAVAVSSVQGALDETPRVFRHVQIANVSCDVAARSVHRRNTSITKVEYNKHAQPPSTDIGVPNV